MGGFAFSADDEWQREFEAAFPYVETEDQLKAIEDVKRDSAHHTQIPFNREVKRDLSFLLLWFYGLRPLPPWRVMVSPVTYEASSEARKTHTRPISCFGSAKRPRGMP